MRVCACLCLPSDPATAHGFISTELLRLGAGHLADHMGLPFVASSLANLFFHGHPLGSPFQSEGLLFDSTEPAYQNDPLPEDCNVMSEGCRITFPVFLWCMCVLRGTCVCVNTKGSALVVFIKFSLLF